MGPGAYEKSEERDLKRTKSSKNGTKKVSTPLSPPPPPSPSLRGDPQGDRNQRDDRNQRNDEDQLDILFEITKSVKIVIILGKTDILPTIDLSRIPF